jgi:pentachlorophenol monooxygenase
MPHTEVLIAGAGPVGLTAALELARRGVECRVVDPILRPRHYAKAAGVQPRSLELFEAMGVLDRVLDSAIELKGQIAFIDDHDAEQHELALPDDVPFGFISIPQYRLEEILSSELASRGIRVQRGYGLTGFTQESTGVVAVVDGPHGKAETRAKYLVGCDGAHSAVRKGLDISFEGGAFDEQYMLGDVEVDWPIPFGYAIRIMRRTSDGPADMLVCVPLPVELGGGRGKRYRMSMLAPAELRADGHRGGDEALVKGRRPQLHHIQAVVDRLSPFPVVARNLRWSSVFRVSHRLAETYRRGRVFLAGDAAHIHPPTGAQGMNTGIQDAHNLAWKLALAVRGEAADALLDSYNAERRPVGEEVVGRTVRSAREGMGSDLKSLSEAIRREAQLLISYEGSPILSSRNDACAAGPGERAPDARGLTRVAVTGSFRLFTLIANHHHTCIFYVDEDTPAQAITDLESIAATAVDTAHGHLDVLLIAAPGTDVARTALPVIRDGRGEFAAAYHPTNRAALVVRPDGYLGYRSDTAAVDGLDKYLALTFR